MHASADRTVDAGSVVVNRRWKWEGKGKVNRMLAFIRSIYSDAE